MIICTAVTVILNVILQKGIYQMSKYFNTTEHNKSEQRKDRLMNALVWATMGFAAIGVLSTFSLVLTMVWGAV